MNAPGHEVDQSVLDGISSKLRNTSAQVDELANSVPGAPDAGEGTAAVMDILVKLTDNAGQLVIGAAAAGDAVSKANVHYGENDASSAATLKRNSGTS